MNCGPRPLAAHVRQWDEELDLWADEVRPYDEAAMTEAVSQIGQLAVTLRVDPEKARQSAARYSYEPLAKTGLLHRAIAEELNELGIRKEGAIEATARAMQGELQAKASLGEKDLPDFEKRVLLRLKQLLGSELDWNDPITVQQWLEALDAKQFSKHPARYRALSRIWLAKIESEPRDALHAIRSILFGEPTLLKKDLARVLPKRMVFGLFGARKNLSNLNKPSKAPAPQPSPDKYGRAEIKLPYGDRAIIKVRQVAYRIRVSGHWRGKPEDLIHAREGHYREAAPEPYGLSPDNPYLHSRWLEGFKPGDYLSFYSTTGNLFSGVWKGFDAEERLVLQVSDHQEVLLDPSQLAPNPVIGGHSFPAIHRSHSRMGFGDLWFKTGWFTRAKGALKGFTREGDLLLKEGEEYLPGPTITIPRSKLRGFAHTYTSPYKPLE